jgi:hypothetical protein
MAMNQLTRARPRRPREERPGSHALGLGQRLDGPLPAPRGKIARKERRPDQQQEGRAEPEQRRRRLERRAIEHEIAVAPHHVVDDVVIAAAFRDLLAICARRSTASAAFESAIVWFWHTRQRSCSASRTARCACSGSCSVGTASPAHAMEIETNTRNMEMMIFKDVFDFGSDRSGLPLFSDGGGAPRRPQHGARTG